MSLPVDDRVESPRGEEPTVVEPHATGPAADETVASASVSGAAPSATAHPTEPSPAPTRGPAIAREICPYLGAASGAWRSAAPHRDHRCEAVDPPAALPTEKQRRLCLTLEHASCPAFRAHRSGRAAMLAPGLDPSVVAVADAARRPIARTSPVVLEQPRLSAPTARWPLDRAVSQAALVALMIVAFVAVAIARLALPDAAVVPPPSGPPSPLATATPSATPRATPSASPAASASVPPSAGPPSAAAYRTTYKVKRGDTLIGIAAKYDTSVAAIRRLNGMSGSNLKVGQVLKIP
jgi:LysM repeat protein